MKMRYHHKFLGLHRNVMRISPPPPIKMQFLINHCCMAGGPVHFHLMFEQLLLMPQPPGLPSTFKTSIRESYWPSNHVENVHFTNLVLSNFTDGWFTHDCFLAYALMQFYEKQHFTATAFEVQNINFGVQIIRVSKSAKWYHWLIMSE